MRSSAARRRRADVAAGQQRRNRAARRLSKPPATVGSPIGGMSMKQLKHWQDAVNAVLGVWMALSPWALGHAAEIVPTSNAVIVGLALLAAALGAILVPRAWEEWTEAVL